MLRDPFRCVKGWFFHKELRMWLTRVANMEPLVKTNTYERGYYHCFDPMKWETVRKVTLLLFFYFGHVIISFYLFFIFILTFASMI